MAQINVKSDYQVHSRSSSDCCLLLAIFVPKYFESVTLEARVSVVEGSCRCEDRGRGACGHQDQEDSQQHLGPPGGRGWQHLGLEEMPGGRSCVAMALAVDLLVSAGSGVEAGDEEELGQVVEVAPRRQQVTHLDYILDQEEAGGRPRFIISLRKTIEVVGADIVLMTMSFTNFSTNWGAVQY